MKKKVIFICSANHSGSTFFDLMLSNGQADIKSCGELHWLDKEHKKFGWEKRHENSMKIWPKYKDVQEDIAKGVDVYKSISNRFGANIIIDSSKTPNWIEPMSIKLWNSEEFTPEFFIIYKTPLELAHSIFKRNMPYSTLKSIYVSWYTHYLRVAYHPLVVAYKDLVDKPKIVLKAACDYVKIPYYDGKERFWEQEIPYLVAGCAETMTHFFTQDSKAYNNRVKYIQNTQARSDSDIAGVKRKYKTLYYDDGWKSLDKGLVDKINGDKDIQNIYRKLEERKLKV